MNCCTQCNGEGMLLGVLGTLQHYRCRQCGWGFTVPVEAETGFRKDSRVELHPGTDRWIMGDRFGEVLGVTKAGLIRVKLDKSGKTLKFKPENLRQI